jgi:hypothetical protein
MLQFKTHLLRKPPEGWHYIEDTQTIEGDTPEDVEKKIAAYRVRNGRPPGDPHQDMIHFWYAKRPEFLEKAVEGTAPRQISRPDELGSVLLWLQRLTQMGPDIEIGSGVIKERCSVCLECPNNIPLSGDAGIKSEVDRRSFMLRKGEIMPGLHFCSHHRVDLRVAVRLRTEFLSPTAGQPAPCWMK